MIACKTRIGIGSEREGTAIVHGMPLALDDATRLMEKLAKESDDGLWKKITPTPRSLTGPLPRKGTFAVPIPKVNQYESSRAVSGAVLGHIMKKYGDRIVGSSADLAGSANVITPHNKSITPKNPDGNFIEFGVREHLMAAAMNGMSLSGYKTFCSTFLVFSDYMRPAIRLAAIMKVPQIFVLSHDSIGLGEDGKTHQAIEQLESLRAMPNLNVFRPASAAEVAFAWEYALNNAKTPSVISLSRQKFNLAPDVSFDKIAKGGYIVSSAGKKRHITIIATGSEVALAMSAAKILAAQNINAAVVSIPSVELFRAQSQKYRDEVLRADDSIIVSLEAGTTSAWREFAEITIGIDEFGLSGTSDAVMAHFGFTPSKIARRILEEFKV
jgi:transketolase